MSRYSFYLGRHVVDGETTFKAAPMVDCRLGRLLFNVEQPPATRWRRRRRPLATGMRRERLVKHYVRLEQVRLKNTVLLIEDWRRIGNGSMIDRNGFPLVMFEPSAYKMPLISDVFIPKDEPLVLRLYGSSYGLVVSAMALVEA